MNGILGRADMDFDTIFRRLRGALGNALVWGAGWAGVAAAAGAVFAVLGAVGLLPPVDWGEALSWAVRFGVVGFVAGGAFSGVVGLLYRGRRLSELSLPRFAVGGGVVTAVFVPLFLQTMNLLSGDGLVPWELVLDDSVWTGVLGAVVAGGSLKLARMADRALPRGGREPVEGAECPEPLSATAERGSGTG